MKKTLHIAVSTLIVAMMISCDNGDKQSLVTGSPTRDIIPTSSVEPAQHSNAVPTSANIVLNPKHGEPGHRCDIAVGAPLSGATTTPAKQASPVITSTPASSVTPALNLPQVSNDGNVKLNPKHGEPGHRCDIKVGAPLPGSTVPVQAAAPVVTNNSASAPILPSLNLPQLSNTGTVKLNPKHGQPGHRCDIAVGAPLNSTTSAPVNTGIPPATTTATSNPTPASPALLLPQLPAAGALKLNPKHGQPGHRCDIAVGAPLK